MLPNRPIQYLNYWIKACNCSRNLGHTACKYVLRDSCSELFHNQNNNRLVMISCILILCLYVSLWTAAGNYV